MTNYELTTLFFQTRIFHIRGTVPTSVQVDDGNAFLNILEIEYNYKFNDMFTKTGDDNNKIENYEIVLFEFMDIAINGRKKRVV